MATAIFLPDLQAGRETVRVSCWLVELGDSIEEGDRIVEVLVPGITFDISAPTSGRLSRIERMADSPVSAGDILGWIE